MQKRKKEHSGLDDKILDSFLFSAVGFVYLSVHFGYKSSYREGEHENIYRISIVTEWLE